MVIKVLGPGCAACQETERVVRAAVDEAGCAATVEKISDFKTMMAFGVLSTPAVVLDGSVVCSGRVPSRSEVLTWIATGADRV